MIDLLLENQIIKLVEKSRKQAELKLKSSYHKPEEVLKNLIDTNFKNINSFNDNLNNSTKNSPIVFVDKVTIEQKNIKPKGNRSKTILGSAFVIA